MRLAIIGGGAAGIFAAIIAATAGTEVHLFEKTNQLLSKVKISGGGRCNVTHACFDPKELVRNYPRGEKELLGPFSRFQPKDMIAWFKERGVQLKKEEDGRMFPTSDSSQTIIDCLLLEAKRAGVMIHQNVKIRSIKNHFILEASQGEYKFDRLLLATGSSKQGYEWAKEQGHTIIDPVPSLFTFNVPSSPLLDLAGVSMDRVRVSLGSLEQIGPLLITHWGFSGPSILKLSAWGSRRLHEKGYRSDFTIQWVPDKSFEAILDSLKQERQKASKSVAVTRNLFSIPKSLWKQLATLSGIGSKQMWGQVSNAAIIAFAKKLFSDVYQIDGKTTYKQEFVTCGGIRLGEVNFTTMESKICSGLYFAGEILDIDGVTGGFNFQAAWTTAWIAANAQQGKG